MSSISTEYSSKINGLIKTISPDRLPDLIKILEDFAVKDGSPSAGDNGTTIIDPTNTDLEIVAKRRTLIKRYARQSVELSPKDYKQVESGKALKVSSVVVAPNGHLQIATQAGSPDIPGYIWPDHWIIPQGLILEVKKASHEPVRTVFDTEVEMLKLSQPDAVTCQAACIAMAIGSTDIHGIRASLRAGGKDAGDPWVMGAYLSKQLGDRYEFDENASLAEMRDWLKQGELIITHGWFTYSGHVICLDGVSIDPGTTTFRFNVADPWSEFDFVQWSYNKPGVKFYDGYYSALGIYASCVASWTYSQARGIYSAGKINSALKGAWAHRIKPVGY